MRVTEIAELIPVAMRELHESGHPWIYINELGRQVTSHDETYMRKRAWWRRQLARVGIHIDEYPSGWMRPRPSDMYFSLHQLEAQGVVEGQFIDNPPGQDGPQR